MTVDACCLACQKPVPPDDRDRPAVASVAFSHDSAGDPTGSGKAEIKLHGASSWRVIEIIDDDQRIKVRCWFCPDHFPSADDAPVADFVEAFARCIGIAINSYETMRRRAAKGAFN